MTWDFYKDGITQSFICSYLQCKQQTKERYINGWKPKKVPIWFQFGKCVHYVLQKSYSKLEFPRFAEIDKWCKEYFDNLDSQITSSYEDEQNETILAIIRKMMPWYFVKYKDDFKKYHWLKVEQNFKVPFRNTYLCGRWDGVLETELENINLIDHKCLSMINEDELGLMLPMDVQINTYLYAAKALFNKFPKKIYYNIIRRPSERRGKKTIQEFADYIGKNVAEKPEHYFIRLPISITEEEHYYFINNILSPVVDEIEQWYKNGCKSYINPVALSNKYGVSDMFNLLVNKFTDQYYQKEHVFEELTE